MVISYCSPPPLPSNIAAGGGDGSITVKPGANTGVPMATNKSRAWGRCVTPVTAFSLLYDTPRTILKPKDPPLWESAQGLKFVFCFLWNQPALSVK